MITAIIEEFIRSAVIVFPICIFIMFAFGNKLKTENKGENYMIFIELSDSQDQSTFNLRIDLIESVTSTVAGKAQIVLTTGRTVFCHETRQQVMRIINDTLAKAFMSQKVVKRKP